MDAVLQILDRFVSGDPPERDGVDGDRASFWTTVEGLVAGFAAPDPVPPGLVARPCPRSGAAWHAGCLKELVGTPSTETARVRTAYHAHWLAHFLAPNDPAHLPMVSVVIPVYNRATIVRDAIDSCLAQTYRNLEIVVVDDGSSDDLRASLAPYGDRIILLRQDNQGPSAARNRGIGVATGDFIHFLDSDDVLHPECIERKIAAFRAVPDAGICCNRSFAIGRGGFEFLQMRMSPKDVWHGVTKDMLAASCRAFPFTISTTMLSRWLTTAAGPFEEDLLRSEDMRYFFKLARTRCKVVAFHDRITLKRIYSDSLDAAQAAAGWDASIVHLRNLGDLLETPPDWHYLPEYLRRMIRPLRWQAVRHHEDDPRARQAWDRVLALITGFGDGRPQGGRSPLPVLLSLRFLVDRLMSDIDSDGKALRPVLRPYWAKLDAIARHAAASAAPLAAEDVDYWRDVPNQDWLERPWLAVLASSPSLAESTELMRGRSLRPTVGAWRTYGNVQPLLGPKAARTAGDLADRALWRPARRAVGLGRGTVWPTKGWRHHFSAWTRRRQRAALRREFLDDAAYARFAHTLSITKEKN